LLAWLSGWLHFFGRETLSRCYSSRPSRRRRWFQSCGVIPGRSRGS